MAKKRNEPTLAELRTLVKTLASEYEGEVSVRQIYYRMVVDGYLKPKKGDKKDKQRLYARVCKASAQARLAGDIPFSWFEDRGRYQTDSAAKTCDTNVDAALDTLHYWIVNAHEDALVLDKWYGQPKHVTVGVEKESLQSVFIKPCSALDIGLLVFKGYTSLSTLHHWVVEVGGIYEEHDWLEEAVILYYGDHDPDGFGIPRSALDKILRIAAVEGIELPPIRLKRIALNMDQIERLATPSFPAERRSPRYKRYLADHGIDEAWELDALNPRLLTELIEEAVEGEFDQGIYDEHLAEVENARSLFKERIKDPSWIEGVLEDIE